MKNTALLFAVFCLAAVSSCKKAVHNPMPDVTGKWKLSALRGGLTGGAIPLPGNLPTLSLNADSTYSVDVNQQSGRYHIYQHNSNLYKQAATYISFTDGYSGMITVKRDTLWIADDHVEPITSTYLRVK